MSEQTNLIYKVFGVKSVISVILKEHLWQLVMGKKCMKPLDFVRKYCRHGLEITKLVIFHCHGIKTTIMVFGPIP